MTPARIGQKVGQYLIVREVNRGSMGIVYEAIHDEIGQRAAVKLIYAEFSADENLVKRLLTEARVVSAIEHPSIVRVFDFGRLADESVYLMMEYLDGPSLRQRLAARGGRLAPREALEIGRQMAAALSTVHHRGIIHRDLKPENTILVRDPEAPEGERAKVVDFGIARFMAASERITPAHSILGTPLYLAPELCGFDGDASEKTDVYALGAMMYEMLGGHPPFTMEGGRGIFNLLLMHRREPPAPLGSLAPDLPESVTGLVHDMLAKEPGGRPTMADIASTIPGLLAHHLARTAGAESSQSSPPRDPFARTIRSSADPPFSNRPPSPRAHDQKLFGDEARASSAAPSSDKTTSRVPVLIYVSFENEQPKCCSDIGAMREELTQINGIHMHVALPPSPSRNDLLLASRKLQEDIALACPSAAFSRFAGSRLALAVVKEMLRLDFERFGRDPSSMRDAISRQRPARVDMLIQIGAGLPLSDIATASLESVEADYARVAEAVKLRMLPVPRLRLVEGGASREGRGEPVSSDVGAPAFRRVAQIVRATDGGGVFAALETMIRVHEFNRAAAITELVDVDRGDVQGGQPLPGSEVSGTQKRVHDILYESLRQSGRGGRWVVTGQAGVGKSTVLRMVACALARDSFEDPEAAPLPFVFLLQLISVERVHADTRAGSAPHDRGRALFSALLRRWCSWAEGSSRPQLVTEEFVERTIRTRDTVLIFDGIDEFLTNNPHLELFDIRELLSYLSNVLAESGRPAIVLGARSSLPGFRTLASGAVRVLEVHRLSLAEAKRWFPLTADVLAVVNDTEVRGLILTPLVLRWIGPRLQGISSSILSSSTQLLEYALEAIIEESQLLDADSTSGARFDPDEWLAALSLVGWLFFSRFAGEMSMSDLVSAVREMRGRFASRVRNEDLYRSSSDAAAFEILEDSATNTILLRRSVFFPTGRHTVRFMHRQWQDFLASRQFAHYVSSEQIDELGSIGLSLPMFKMAGDMLHQRGFRVKADYVHRIMERSKETRQALVAANFVALLASSRVPMDGGAIELILEAVADLKPLTRLIIVNGLSYRALRDVDPSAPDLRRRLIPLYRRYVAGEFAFAGPGTVLCSIAWCHLKAFASHFGAEPPSGELPMPSTSGNLQEDELQVVCADPSRRHLTPENRSVQAAFLQSQYVVRGDGHRPISVVHYLYYLVLARKYGVHISEISGELPSILDAQGPTARAIVGYAPVPELALLFAFCVDTHESAFTSSQPITST